MEGILQPIMFLLPGTHLNLNQVGRLGVPPPMRGMMPLPNTGKWTISGITRDSIGAVLPACEVDLFETVTDAKRDNTTSDGTGAYSFSVNQTDRYYAVAYLTGSPDRAGTTVNTLTGV